VEFRRDGREVSPARIKRKEGIVGYKFDEFYIPENMLPGLLRWIEDGVMPGDFLRAVLENDFMEAVARADHINAVNLKAYMGYLHWEAPPGCYGSPAAVVAWRDRKKKERGL